tara:strand:+ start:503 stop:850 length:348 start_codon:yes stop_codon:yes gene_type:complete
MLQHHRQQQDRIMTTKIVINCCFGGFTLSKIGKIMYKTLSDREFDDLETVRHDQFLVKTVEQLGDSASGRHSALEVVEVKGSIYRVTEHDGYESIETPDTIVWSDASLPTSTGEE